MRPQAKRDHMRPQALKLGTRPSSSPRSSSLACGTFRDHTEFWQCAEFFVFTVGRQLQLTAPGNHKLEERDRESGGFRGVLDGFAALAVFSGLDSG